MTRFRNGERLSDRPFGGMLAGARGDQVIGLAFKTKKAEDRSQRRQTDSALAQPPRVQPGFVELESGRQQVRDSLMQTGHEQATHDGVIHTVRFVIWRCSEERGGKTAGAEG